MTWQLELPGRPPNLNAERAANRYRRHDTTKAWRQMAAVLWRSGVNEGRYPAKLTAITVEAQQVVKDGRWHIDAGSTLPAVKAGVDGLVDAGLLVDDDWRFVRGLTFTPPLVAGRDGLLLTIREVAA